MTSPFSAPDPVSEVDVPAGEDAVDLTHLALVLADLAHAQLRIAELQQIVQEKRAVIEGALGDSEVGLIDGTPAVTYRRMTSKRIDTTKLKKEHPDLALALTTESTSRRFLVLGT